MMQIHYQIVLVISVLFFWVEGSSKCSKITGCCSYLWSLMINSRWSGLKFLWWHLYMLRSTEWWLKKKATKIFINILIRMVPSHSLEGRKDFLILFRTTILITLVISKNKLPLVWLKAKIHPTRKIVKDVSGFGALLNIHPTRSGKWVVNKLKNLSKNRYRKGKSFF